jgi:hypothetical protein
LPRLSIQRVAMGQSCDASRLAALLRLRITRITTGYHVNTRAASASAPRGLHGLQQRAACDGRTGRFRPRATRSTSTAAPFAAVRGTVACGEPPPNGSALLWAEAFPLSLDRGPSAHRSRGRNCFLPTNGKYHDLAAVGIASMTLHQTRRLASKRAPPPYGSRRIAALAGPVAC